MSSILLTNAKLATMLAGAQAYGFVENGAIAITDARITWCGSADNMPQEYRSWPNQDAQGRLITPAPIDCHTHLIFAGNRAHEFEMRLGGASYEEVALAGGGIVSTVKATREASDEELLKSALLRVDHFIAEGVSDLEIKSGYGLTIEAELRMLRVARRIALERPITIHTSFLGAHSIPAEYKGRADDYIDEVCLPALEAAHKESLVDAVDGFCERIAFSPEQIERVFIYARELGIPVKLHAEQISNLGGATLASNYNALSADHLEYIDKAGVQAMATAGTVAVLLPGAFYTLRETQLPPIALLRQHGVAMAVATDCNPGSSPLHSILLAANMACTLFQLTPEEALAGITREAAKALGLANSGVIAAGKRADLTIWNIGHPAELSYHMGFNPLHQRIFGGNVCTE